MKALRAHREKMQAVSPPKPAPPVAAACRSPVATCCGGRTPIPMPPERPGGGAGASATPSGLPSGGGFGSGATTSPPQPGSLQDVQRVAASIRAGLAAAMQRETSETSGGAPARGGPTEPLRVPDPSAPSVRALLQPDADARGRSPPRRALPCTLAPIPCSTQRLRSHTCGATRRPPTPTRRWVGRSRLPHWTHRQRPRTRRWVGSLPLPRSPARPPPPRSRRSLLRCRAGRSWTTAPPARPPKTATNRLWRRGWQSRFAAAAAAQRERLGPQEKPRAASPSGATRWTAAAPLACNRRLGARRLSGRWRVRTPRGQRRQRMDPHTSPSRLGPLARAGFGGRE